MVAWFKGRPTHLDGGVREIACLLIATLCVCAQMGDAAKSAATLPLFEKERPKSSTVLDWLKTAKPLLSADQRAIVEGNTPRSLLQYTAATIPPVLVADAATGVTATAAAQREAVRLQIQDSNDLKEQQYRAHESEIRLSLFLAIESAG